MTRSFVHQDPDFGELIRIVAREVGIGAALVEKDYWVTHCMWALHQTGLEIWFKGGTSLSKGAGLVPLYGGVRGTSPGLHRVRRDCPYSYPSGSTRRATVYPTLIGSPGSRRQAWSSK